MVLHGAAPDIDDFLDMLSAHVARESIIVGDIGAVIGAGALGAVMLMALYPMRMSARRLVGTDIVHAVPLTVVAGTGHLIMGNVDWALLGSLLVGSVPGIVIGSLLIAHLHFA